MDQVQSHTVDQEVCRYFDIGINRFSNDDAL
jgi:hypothetical protein